MWVYCAVVASLWTGKMHSPFLMLKQVVHKVTIVTKSVKQLNDDSFKLAWHQLIFTGLWHCVHLYPEDGGNMLFRIVGSHLSAYTVSSNKLYQVVTLLACTREVSVSNLDRGTNYPISWLSSFPSGKCLDSKLNHATTIFFTMTFHCSHRSTIRWRRCTIRATDSVIK
jgi:hypothetical protein